MDIGYPSPVALNVLKLTPDVLVLICLHLAPGLFSCQVSWLDYSSTMTSVKNQ